MSKRNRKRARALWARTGARCHTCTRWIPAGSEFRVVEVDDPTTPTRQAVVATCTDCDPTTDSRNTQGVGGGDRGAMAPPAYTLLTRSKQSERTPFNQDSEEQHRE